MQLIKRVRSSKGSIAVYVSIVIISMLLILLALFFTSNAVRRNQLTTAMKVKETYEADNGRAAEIYENLVENMIPKTVSEAKSQGTTFKDTTPIKDDSNDTIWIPGGFSVASDSATDVDDGVVITDGTNEFVWIPVDDTSLAEMYNTTTPETASDISLTKSQNEETTTTKLYSKLRMTLGSVSGAGIPNSADAREPDIIFSEWLGLDLLKTTFGYTDSTNAGLLKHFAQDMVNEYAEVFNSIKEYDGFYIGRYELTGTLEKPTVKRGETVLTAASANAWYGLKKACSSIVNTNTAKSIMIYGNQWDEVMDWLVDTGARTSNEINSNSSTWGNCSNSSGAAAVEGAGEPQNAGHSDAWSANNIYDLAGNYFEWTQEAWDNSFRVSRGRSLQRFGL